MGGATSTTETAGAVTPGETLEGSAKDAGGAGATDTGIRTGRAPEGNAGSDCEELEEFEEQ